MLPDEVYIKVDPWTQAMMSAIRFVSLYPTPLLYLLLKLSISSPPMHPCKRWPLPWASALTGQQLAFEILIKGLLPCVIYIISYKESNVVHMLPQMLETVA